MNDDDDIQEYVRPWRGLTEEERKEIWNVGEKKDQALRAALIQTIRDVEAKLKEKNGWPMGQLLPSSVSIAKKNTNAQTIGQTNLASAQSLATIRVACVIALNIPALTAMTSSWRCQIMAQIEGFAVVNVSWRTAFSLPTKNARTVVVCLLRWDHPQQREVMEEGFSVLGSVSQKDLVHLKRSHALFAGNFSIPLALKRTSNRKLALQNAWQSFSLALTHIIFKEEST